jgi:hypothetical protein
MAVETLPQIIMLKCKKCSLDNRLLVLLAGLNFPSTEDSLLFLIQLNSFPTLKRKFLLLKVLFDSFESQKTKNSSLQSHFLSIVSPRFENDLKCSLLFPQPHATEQPFTNFLLRCCQS